MVKSEGIIGDIIALFIILFIVGGPVLIASGVYEVFKSDFGLFLGLALGFGSLIALGKILEELDKR